MAFGEFLVGVNKNFEIRSQLIVGYKSLELRKMIMLQPGITLDAILILGRSHELADIRTGTMAGALAKRNPVAKAGTPLPVKEERGETLRAVCTAAEARMRSTTGRGRNGKCQNCRRESHPVEGCPVRRQQCLKCNRFGHFAKVCRGGGGAGFSGLRPPRKDVPSRC